MGFRKLLLMIPLMLVILTSGCTSPICIPFLPFTCERVVEFEDDVIVIKSLEALPQTVSPEQQIRLVAYIQNVGKEPVPQDELELEEITNQDIVVDLYDYCEGLFSEVKVNCGGEQPQSTESTRCENIKLLPGQTKEIDWTLKAGDRDQVPLKTECDLKVSVTYPYKTTSLTMITFIDYQEMQRQLSEGTFRKRESYIVSGYGPVKPRITVEDQQPIPVQRDKSGRTVVALKIKNSGKGYLCRPGLTYFGEAAVVCDSKLLKHNIEIEGLESGDLGYYQGGSCEFRDFGSGFSASIEEAFVPLIKGESPPLLCEIELKANVNLPKESTEHIITEIEYLYEFRKELKVIIEPKF